MKKQTNCYIYTRVSTAMQVDGYSLDAQKEKLRKFAEYEDMKIAAEYSDYTKLQIDSILSADWTDAFQTYPVSFGKIDAFYMIRKSFGAVRAVV